MNRGDAENAENVLQNDVLEGSFRSWKKSNALTFFSERLCALCVSAVPSGLRAKLSFRILFDELFYVQRAIEPHRPADAEVNAAGEVLKLLNLKGDNFIYRELPSAARASA